jgi:hypothetical protein
MNESRGPRSLERFRRVRPARQPRWYLVEGQPRRTLWPPQAALLRAPELRRLIDLARAAAEEDAVSFSPGAGERRWIREVLAALGRALGAGTGAAHESSSEHRT